MIISHKYKFIFIKTAKTAGTSIERYLNQLCGPKDIITEGHLPESGSEPFKGKNDYSWFNPFPEIILNRGLYLDRTIASFIKKQRYGEHMPAYLVKARTPAHIWHDYYKFCIERNPWDKTLSHFHMVRKFKGNNITLDEYLSDEKSLCLNIPLYTDKKGNLLVDKVIKYENLNAELDWLFKQLGIPFQGSLTENANRTFRNKGASYHDELSLKQRDIIQRVFKKEIDMHHYTW